MRLALCGFAGPVDSPRMILGVKIRCRASGNDAADAGGPSGSFGRELGGLCGVSVNGRCGAENPWRNGSLY